MGLNQAQYTGSQTHNPSTSFTACRKINTTRTAPSPLPSFTNHLSTEQPTMPTPKDPTTKDVQAQPHQPTPPQAKRSNQGVHPQGSAANHKRHIRLLIQSPHHPGCANGRFSELARPRRRCGNFPFFLTRTSNLMSIMFGHCGRSLRHGVEAWV